MAVPLWGRRCLCRALYSLHNEVLKGCRLDILPPPTEFAAPPLKKLPGAVASSPPVERSPIAMGAGRMRELPLFSMTEWDSVRLAKAAMQQLERGSLDRAAQIVDAFGRDDRITGVLTTRSGALPSLPMTLEEGTGPRAGDAMDALKRDWNQMFPAAQLAQLVEWGIMLGAAPARLDWQFGKLWTPTLQTWHPRPLTWRTDVDAYFIGTQDAGNIQLTPGDGLWVMFAPYGVKRGWMKGRARSLFTTWLLRQWAMRDWARYSEVHGMPIRKVIIPPNASQEEADKFLNDLVQLASENIIMTKRVADSQGTDPQRDFFDVQLVEAVGRSKEVFEGLIELANTNIAINLLGQNLTTEVKGGSYAAAAAHTAIRNDILQSDAELLGQCLVEQVLKIWCIYNFGDPDAAPKPVWKTKPDQDRVQRGQALMNLGDGIKKLQGTGAHPDIDAMLDDNDIPWKEAASEPPAPPPAPAMPAGAFGKPAAVPTVPGLKAAELEAGVADATVAGQMYADKLASSSRDAGSKVMAADLGDLLDIIDRETSFEGIRKGVEKLYAGMDSTRLAKVLAEALILARLNGRYTVLEENVEDAGR